MASVSDVAASDDPLLKVKADSTPNKVAGAICNVVRESGEPPKVVATGPAAINQAMKAIAIARKYMLEEETGATDLDVSPQFEEDIRQSSRVCFVLGKARKTNPIVSHAPSEPIDELPRPLAVDLCATPSPPLGIHPCLPAPPRRPPFPPLPSPLPPPPQSTPYALRSPRMAYSRSFGALHLPAALGD